MWDNPYYPRPPPPPRPPAPPSMRNTTTTTTSHPPLGIPAAAAAPPPLHQQQLHSSVTVPPAAPSVFHGGSNNQKPPMFVLPPPPPPPPLLPPPPPPLPAGIVVNNNFRMTMMPPPPPPPPVVPPPPPPQRPAVYYQQQQQVPPLPPPSSYSWNHTAPPPSSSSSYNNNNNMTNLSSSSAAPRGGVEIYMVKQEENNNNNNNNKDYPHPGAAVAGAATAFPPPPPPPLPVVVPPPPPPLASLASTTTRTAISEPAHLLNTHTTTTSIPEPWEPPPEMVPTYDNVRNPAPPGRPPVVVAPPPYRPPSPWEPPAHMLPTTDNSSDDKNENAKQSSSQQLRLSVVPPPANAATTQPTGSILLPPPPSSSLPLPVPPHPLLPPPPPPQPSTTTTAATTFTTTTTLQNDTASRTPTPPPAASLSKRARRKRNKKQRQKNAPSNDMVPGQYGPANHDDDVTTAPFQAPQQQGMVPGQYGPVDFALKTERLSSLAVAAAATTHKQPSNKDMLVVDLTVSSEEENDKEECRIIEAPSTKKVPAEPVSRLPGLAKVIQNGQNICNGRGPFKLSMLPSEKHYREIWDVCDNIQDIIAHNRPETIQVIQVLHRKLVSWHESGVPLIAITRPGSFFSFVEQQVFYWCMEWAHCVSISQKQTLRIVVDKLARLKEEFQRYRPAPRQHVPATHKEEAPQRRRSVEELVLICQQLFVLLQRVLQKPQLFCLYQTELLDIVQVLQNHGVPKILEICFSVTENAQLENLKLLAIAVVGASNEISDLLLLEIEKGLKEPFPASGVGDMIWSLASRIVVMLESSKGSVWEALPKRIKRALANAVASLEASREDSMDEHIQDPRRLSWVRRALQCALEWQASQTPVTVLQDRIHVLQQERLNILQQQQQGVPPMNASSTAGEPQGPTSQGNSVSSHPDTRLDPANANSHEATSVETMPPGENQSKLDTEAKNLSQNEPIVIDEDSCTNAGSLRDSEAAGLEGTKDSVTEEEAEIPTEQTKALKMLTDFMANLRDILISDHREGRELGPLETDQGALSEHLTEITALHEKVIDLRMESGTIEVLPVDQEVAYLKEMAKVVMRGDKATYNEMKDKLLVLEQIKSESVATGGERTAEGPSKETSGSDERNDDDTNIRSGLAVASSADERVSIDSALQNETQDCHEMTDKDNPQNRSEGLLSHVHNTASSIGNAGTILIDSSSKQAQDGNDGETPESSIELAHDDGQIVIASLQDEPIGIGQFHDDEPTESSKLKAKLVDALKAKRNALAKKLELSRTGESRALSPIDALQPGGLDSLVITNIGSSGPEKLIRFTKPRDLVDYDDDNDSEPAVVNSNRNPQPVQLENGSSKETQMKPHHTQERQLGNSEEGEKNPNETVQQPGKRKAELLVALEVARQKKARLELELQRGTGPPEAAVPKEVSSLNRDDLRHRKRLAEQRNQFLHYKQLLSKQEILFQSQEKALKESHKSMEDAEAELLSCKKQLTEGEAAIRVLRARAACVSKLIEANERELAEARNNSSNSDDATNPS